MLVIEMVSGSDVLEFGTGQSIAVYINDEQIIVVRTAKLINRSNFSILVKGAKIFINEVRVVYRT